MRHHLPSEFDHKDFMILLVVTIIIIYKYAYIDMGLRLIDGNAN